MREKVAYEIDVLGAKYVNLQESCKVQYKRLDELTADTKVKTEEVKNREQETELHKRQIEKVDRVCSVLRDKIDASEKSKIEMEMEKRSVREAQLKLEAGNPPPFLSLSRSLTNKFGMLISDQADHNRRIQIGKREIKKVQVEDRRIKKVAFIDGAIRLRMNA